MPMENLVRQWYDTNKNKDRGYFMNPIGTNIIDTPHFRLRPLQVEDYKEMYENWAKKEEACRYFPFYPADNIEVYKEKVSGWVKNYRNPYYFQWVIEEKNTSRLVGIINLGNVDQIKKMSDVCYILSPDEWGKGIMTEVLREVLHYAFCNVGLEKVQAEVFDGNIASAAVLRKCGMKFERREKELYYKDQKYFDVDVFSINQEEYIRNH